MTNKMVPLVDVIYGALFLRKQENEPNGTIKFKI